MNHRITRFYNSAILAILPSVETILAGLARAISFLERREAALEAHIEASITAIVEDGKAHQDALQTVNNYFAKRNAKNLSLVGKARKEAEAAVAARTAVENLLNGAG